MIKEADGSLGSSHTSPPPTKRVLPTYPLHQQILQAQLRHIAGASVYCGGEVVVDAWNPGYEGVYLLES